MSESLDWRVVSIYKETGAYAREHNELDAFRASNAANSSCVKDIEKAIADSWDGMRLKDGCALSVIEKYGENRVMHVLANTLQLKKYDGRFSRDNMAWAQMVQIEAAPADQPSDRRYS